MTFKKSTTFKNLSLATFALLFAVSSAGCGKSPLLNHEEAGAGNEAPLLNSNNAETCELNFAKAGLCASLSWTKPPSQDEENSFTLRFWNKKNSTSQGPYVNPENEVFTKLWMPSMGHGSAPVDTKRATNGNGDEIPGVYKATKVYFTMGGVWDVRIQLRKDKKVVEEASITLSIE